MGFVRLCSDRERNWALFLSALLCLMVDLVSSNVVLMGKNVTLSFDDVEANFSPAVKGSGVCGVIYAADPLDACDNIKNKSPDGQNSAFLLVMRGKCTFDEKVRNAQNAGYKAAIVYDNEDNGALVSMAGTSSGIHIYAVFVSKSSGETLRQYSSRTDIEVWIIPTFENSAWSIMAISFISLLAMSAVLATCFFIRRHRIRRMDGTMQGPDVREFHGMSSQLVKAMPSVVFTSVLEESCTGSTCAICLEDYCVGDKLRILPCRHKFHAVCVDLWLTSWRTFCPVCKRDARAEPSIHALNPPPSESTPLLSVSPSPLLSSFHSNLSSFHSNLSSSPSIPISSRPPRSNSHSQSQSQSQSHSHSQSVSRTYSRIPNPYPPSYSSPYSSPYNHHSPAITISRSSADLRHISSSYRSRSGAHAHVSSPHSLGFFPSTSPLGYRYGSPYNVPGSSVESSGWQSYLRHCGESGASLSAMASEQSLPGC